MIAIARVSPIAVLLIGLIVLAACGDGDDPVVAEVGVVEIHASRLAQFVERLPEGMRSQQQGLEATREYLSSIRSFCWQRSSRVASTTGSRCVVNSTPEPGAGCHSST